MEPDIAPGRYSFNWLWKFKDPSVGAGDVREFYTTCWEAEVVSSLTGAVKGE